MSTTGDGGGPPRLVDDRLPVLLVVLDGLGDRAAPELGGRTPAEAAATPVLDALARRGASGWHLPFGWGRAPASELAHWAMFGYGSIPFPGRAVLEALGAGVDVPLARAVTHAALRTSQRTGDEVWITGRCRPGDGEDGAALLAALTPVVAAHGFSLHPLSRGGEALLVSDRHRSGAVTDSDPFFEDLHPWLRVQATRPDGTAAAVALNALLLDARNTLLDARVNSARRERGLPALDVLTTKWSGVRSGVPSFEQRTGVAGAAVTTTGLYRGLARLLGMASRHLPDGDTVTGDLHSRLVAADEMIAAGARFVHVHTKATDEAGHRKDPDGKRSVIEAADAGLAALAGMADRAIVAVTGDHATPSSGGVLHSGDPTPLVVAGPTVRPDGVTHFGEEPAAGGAYGTVAAADLLPLLFGHANRPAFLGHRATPEMTVALPDAPVPMPPGCSSLGGGRGPLEAPVWPASPGRPPR